MSNKKQNPKIKEEMLGFFEEDERNPFSTLRQNSLNEDDIKESAELMLEDFGLDVKTNYKYKKLCKQFAEAVKKI